MSDEKKNGRFHIGTAVIVLGMIGGPLAVWGDSQRKDAVRDEKITNVEKRQAEDRQTTKESLRQVDTKVERIDENVQQILQTIKAMEAVQRADRRRQ